MAQLQPTSADVLAHPAIAAFAENEDWWSDCSTEDLKRLIGVGPAAGERFTIAAREIERRAAEARTLSELRAGQQVSRERRQLIGLSLTIVAGGMLLTLLVVWLNG